MGWVQGIIVNGECNFFRALTDAARLVEAGRMVFVRQNADLRRLIQGMMGSGGIEGGCVCGTHICTCVCRRIIVLLIAQDFGGQAGADHIHRHILASEQARKEMGSTNALQILASAWEGREEAREKLHQSMLEKDALVDLLICFQTVSTGATGFQIVSTVSRDRAIRF